MAAPASAGVVFSDGFDGENGGNSALNYAGFANVAVSGKVDLVKSGDFGIQCVGATGSCVDLDGTSGPGSLMSLSSFAYSAGDKIRFTVSMSGSQRQTTSDSFFLGFQFASPANLLNYGFNFANFGGGDIIVLPATTTGNVTTSFAIAGNEGFGLYSLFFTAANAGSVKFLVGTNSADNVGPVVDNLKLTIDGRVPEPAAWAMMLAGFGLVGAAMRRRQMATIANA